MTLRFSVGVTKVDRIRNKPIRGNARRTFEMVRTEGGLRRQGGDPWMWWERTWRKLVLEEDAEDREGERKMIHCSDS